jgi:hypothetical protein
MRSIPGDVRFQSVFVRQIGKLLQVHDFLIAHVGVKLCTNPLAQALR